MKPGKTRLKRRAQACRWMELSSELEMRANIYTQARHEPDKPGDLRVARVNLLKAALDFATAVDGED